MQSGETAFPAMTHRLVTLSLAKYVRFGSYRQCLNGSVSGFAGMDGSWSARGCPRASAKAIPSSPCHSRSTFSHLLVETAISSCLHEQLVHLAAKAVRFAVLNKPVTVDF